MTNPLDGFFGGPKSLSFGKVGDYTWAKRKRGGTILEDPTVTQQIDMTTQKPKTWDDGRPMNQMVLVVQTGTTTDTQEPKVDEHDDGVRRLFVKGDMIRAIRVALQRVGQKNVGKGGQLFVTWIDEKPASKPGLNDRRIFEAEYLPPSASFLAEEQQATQASSVSAFGIAPQNVAAVPAAPTPFNQPGAPAAPAAPFGSQPAQPAAPAAPANPFS